MEAGDPGSVRVRIDGNPARLLYGTGSGLVVAVPYEVAVLRSDYLAGNSRVRVRESNPGLYTVNRRGNGLVEATHADG